MATVLLTSAACPRSALAQPVDSPAAPSVEAPTSHPLDQALVIARDCLRHIHANVSDYTATLVKRSRVQGELGPYQQLFVKIRNRRVENGRLVVPMSVYLKYQHPADARGREVIWVEGRNNGKLVAHDTGIKGLIRVSLDPHGAIAMRGQRYPITEIGLENLAQKLIEKGERDRRHGECQVKFYDAAKIAERPCRMIQIEHPVKRPHFDFYRAQVFIDHQLGVPVRYASWSWSEEPAGEPVLEEEYTYTDVRVNLGLTDLDFDPDNKAYGF